MYLICTVRTQSSVLINKFISGVSFKRGSTGQTREATTFAREYQHILFGTRDGQC